MEVTIKPLRYFRVITRFAFKLTSLVTTLHHRNCLLFVVVPSMADCARDAEEKKENAKSDFGRKN